MADTTTAEVLAGITDEGQRETVKTLIDGINKTAETNIGNLQSKFDTKSEEEKTAYRKLELEVAGLKDKGDGSNGNAELSESQKEMTARFEREDREAKESAKVSGLESELAGYRNQEFENKKAAFKAEGMPDDLLDQMENSKDADKFHALWKATGGEKKPASRAAATNTGTINRSTSGSDNELSEYDRTSQEVSELFPGRAGT